MEKKKKKNMTIRPRPRARGVDLPVDGGFSVKGLSDVAPGFDPGECSRLTMAP